MPVTTDYIRLIATVVFGFAVFSTPRCGWLGR